MRLTIAAVGRLKRAPEEELSCDYFDRAGKMGRKLGIRSIAVLEAPESNAANPAQRKKEEARALIGKAGDNVTLVALDERGKSLTSEEFSQYLSRCLLQGARSVCFLIGGPDGLDPDLLARADLRMSFGTMTWPHRLARVMLSEQIYRAVTILANHPYHRP